jgi:regulator of protease activity HflC (stomatin/prohibitin superfamily)
MLLRKIVIGSTERGILFKDKQFVELLAPGTYRYLNLLQNYSAEVIDAIKNPEFIGSTAKLVMSGVVGSNQIERFFVRVITGPREVAVMFLDNAAYKIISPSQDRLFWRGVGEYRIERFDISDNYELSASTIRDLSLIIDSPEILQVLVPEKSVGILYDSGVIARELSAGRYAFFRTQRKLNAVVIDTRLTSLEVSGQEMLTKDKVSLRLNLAVSYRPVNIQEALRAVSDLSAEVYRSAQLSLRQAVGEKTLDELLESKEALNKALAIQLSTGLQNFGIEITRVGVKDIILPGEMRTLFNQVVEAEKAAQAQNIKRREETAATRSLLNTAKLMENNPVLLRLKELEAVERISEKVEKLTVYDGLKGVVNGLVTLKD